MEKALKQFLQAGNMTVANLLLQNYRQLGMNEQELVLFLELSSSIQAGDSFPAIDQIASYMYCDSNQLYQLLHRLFEKKLLEIKSVTDENGKSHDVYQFDLMYEKLFWLLRQKDQQTQQQILVVDQSEIFQAIEKEFGRTLSPIEMETIEQWFSEDHYQPELILLALREAVLSQAYSLKYIDRVLLSWEKKNIKTAAQVQQLKEQQRERRLQRQQTNFSQRAAAAKKPKIPLQRWAHSDNPAGGDD
ncbi:MAG: DnaD domain protein [Liquorilactobacillus nagelii]|uniref:DNA replication protein DnaD n=2 Tax=Liquorilactobacillus nagelii TaxID=82688 RepID=A0A3S6QV68_9LACO|nr:DnaD domain protein [Liquorilactobacillus nagelii]AUJ31840.1 DNA replication protein DnaD [Liquorilactobacillus nagelii]MCC7615781.1 DNA replication protein DnaD [Liquorilactobacillus nagelii]MCP9314087.1 DnaD domain protein [Liquorilactobacillus nagelii]